MESGSSFFVLVLNVFELVLFDVVELVADDNFADDAFHCGFKLAAAAVVGGVDEVYAVFYEEVLNLVLVAFGVNGD